MQPGTEIGEKEKSQRNWKKDLPYIVLLVLVSLTMLTWFKNGDLMLGNVLGWRIDFFEYWDAVWHTWLEKAVGYGNSGTRQLPFLFPFIAIGTAFQWLFENTHLYQKVYFTFYFALSGIASFFLFTKLGVKRLPSLLGALYYMINPYTQLVIWNPSQGFIFPFYAGLPLGIYLLLLTFERPWFFLWANLILFISGMSVSYVNPTYFIIFGIYCSIITIAIGIEKAKQNPSQLFTIIKRAMAFASVFLLLNAYWLIPFTQDISNEYKQANHTFLGLEDDLSTFALNSATPSELLRMLGIWFAHAGARPGEKYMPWYEPLYSNNLITIISYLFPCLVILGFIAVSRKRFRLGYAWCLIFLLSMLAIIGLKTEFANSIQKIYESVPFLLRAFRQGYLKVGLLYVLPYTILLTFGIALLHQKWKKLVLWLVIPIGLIGLPMLKGEIFREKDMVSLRSDLVQVPPAYKQIQEWDATYPIEARYLQIPLIKGGSSVYDWEQGYSGPDILYQLLRKPTAFSVHGNDIVNQLNLAIKLNDRESFEQLLPYLNVQNIIINRDVCLECLQNYGALSAEEMKKFESQLPPPALHFGSSLSVIPISTDLFLPRIYSPKQSFYAKELGIEHFESIVGTNKPLKSSAIFFEKDNTIKPNIFKENEQYFEEILPENIPTVVHYDTTAIERINEEKMLEMKKKLVLSSIKDEDFAWSKLNSKEYAVVQEPASRLLIRTDGEDSERSLSFKNLQEAPYIFPEFSPESWTAINSTIVYAKTGYLPLLLSKIKHENGQASLVSMWWETDWRGMSTKNIELPIEIPPNQKVIIQLNGTDFDPQSVTVEEEPEYFTWDSISAGQYTIRRNDDWTTIIRTDGLRKESTLSFDSIEKAPYTFPEFSQNGWNTLNAALIYLKTSDTPITIEQVLKKEDGLGIAGAWWETGWIGMSTKEVHLPFVIPAHQRAILQLDPMDKSELYKIRLITSEMRCNSTLSDFNWNSILPGTAHLEVISKPEEVEGKYLNHDLYTCNLAALGNSYLYIKTAEDPLHLIDLLENDQRVLDIAGIWWEDQGRFKKDSYSTVSYAPSLLPIKIPPHKKAVLQILHEIKGNFSATTVSKSEGKKQETDMGIDFKKIDQTKYLINIFKAAEPFMLVFNETMVDKWNLKVLANEQTKEGKDPVISMAQLTESQKEAYLGPRIEGSRQNNALPVPNKTQIKNGYNIPQDFHVVANGYANAWWVDTKSMCSSVAEMQQSDAENKVRNKKNSERNAAIDMQNRALCQEAGGSWHESLNECKNREELIYLEVRSDSRFDNTRCTQTKRDTDDKAIYKCNLSIPMSKDFKRTEKAYIFPDETALLKAKKEGTGFCSLNADGTYNLQLQLEFEIQKIFYKNLAISAITLMLVITGIWFTSNRKRAKETTIW